MAWVYVLTTKSEKFYVGSTQNLDERMKHHFRNATPSTKRLHVESLALAQKYDSLAGARRVERKIKKLKRRDYIVRMLRDGYIKVSPL